MTPEEIIDFFAPQQSTTDSVVEWLVESGITTDRFAVSANKQVLQAQNLDSDKRKTNANTIVFSGSNLMPQLPK